MQQFVAKIVWITGRNYKQLNSLNFMDPEEEVIVPEGEEEIMPDPEPTDELELEPASEGTHQADEGVA